MARPCRLDEAICKHHQRDVPTKHPRRPAVELVESGRVWQSAVINYVPIGGNANCRPIPVIRRIDPWLAHAGSAPKGAHTHLPTNVRLRVGATAAAYGCPFLRFTAKMLSISVLSGAFSLAGPGAPIRQNQGLWGQAIELG